MNRRGATIVVAAALAIGAAGWAVACTDDGSGLDDDAARQVIDAAADPDRARAFVADPDALPLLFEADPADASAVVEAATGGGGQPAVEATRQVLVGAGEAGDVHPELARTIATAAAPSWSDLAPAADDVVPEPGALTPDRLTAAFERLLPDDETAALLAVGVTDAALAAASPAGAAGGTLDELATGLAEITTVYESLVDAARADDETGAELDRLVTAAFAEEQASYGAPQAPPAGELGDRAEQVRAAADDVDGSAGASAGALDLALFATALDLGAVPDPPTVPAEFLGADGTVVIPPLGPVHNDYVHWTNGEFDRMTEAGLPDPADAARVATLRDEVTGITTGLRAALGTL